MNTIKNIVFDLGNVLITFEPVPFLMEVLGDEGLSRECARKVFHHPTWRELDAGRLTVEEGKQRFLEQNPELETAVNTLFDHWLDMFQPIEANVKLLPRLKARGYRLFVLSNCIKESYEVLRSRAGFFDYMDGIVASYQINMLKPDREIYEHLLSAHQLQPDETLFLDDLAENVEGARQAGIQAEWVETPESVHTILQRYQAVGQIDGE